jgi:hypothetical protein
VGAERTCELAANRWSVLPHGDKSQLTSQAEVEIKGGLLGRLLEPILRPLMRRHAPQALAAFKYLVEQGQPYHGKSAHLPKAAALC